MNNQEAFTKAVTHMRTHPQAIEHGRCVYATTDGNACAVGCLLPFELAVRVEAEASECSCFSTGWSSIRRIAEMNPDSACAEAVKLLEGVDTELLLSLQDIHDTHDKREAAEDALDILAARYGLLEVPA